MFGPIRIEKNNTYTLKVKCLNFVQHRGILHNVQKHYFLFLIHALTATISFTLWPFETPSHLGDQRQNIIIIMMALHDILLT